MLSGVYAIRNIVNGHRYVGSSVNIKKRFAAHRRDLNAQNHHSSHLQRAWLKYGPSVFVFEIVEYAEKNSLTEKEQHHIRLSSAYNVNPDAGRPPVGSHTVPHTAETKLRISTVKRGCSNPHGRPAVETACRVCGHKFFARATLVASGRKKYCSRRCMGLAASTRMVALAASRRGVPLSLSHREKISKGLRQCSTGF